MRTDFNSSSFFKPAKELYVHIWEFIFILTFIHLHVSCYYRQRYIFQVFKVVFKFITNYWSCWNGKHILWNKNFNKVMMHFLEYFAFTKILLIWKFSLHQESFKISDNLPNWTNFFRSKSSTSATIRPRY